MIKQLFILLLLVASLQPARSQATRESLPSQQFKQQLRGQYLQNDTAQAIITLYARRQAGGVGWISAAALSALRLAIGTTTTPTSSPYYTNTSTDDSGSRAGVALLVAAPVAAYGVAKLLHYSNANLSRVLTAYAAGLPLPRSLRRKLKPRFFQAPIVQYKKVKYKPAN